MGISNRMKHNILSKLVLTAVATSVILSGPVQATPDSLDSSFGTGGKVTTAIGSSFDGINDMVIQADAKIVVAGYSYNGPRYDFALARYNPDGTLDSSFGNNGRVTTPIGFASGFGGEISYYNSSGKSLSIDSKGRIVVAGIAGQPDFVHCAVIRYQANGDLDDAFGSGGIVTTRFGTLTSSKRNFYGRVVMVQKDDKILIAGDAQSYRNSSIWLQRFNVDGSFDNTFSDAGVIGGDTLLYVRNAALQADGKILIAASVHELGKPPRFKVYRHDEDGIRDTSFITSERVFTTGVFSEKRLGSMVIQNDGKIVIAETSGTKSTGLLRYQPSGVYDTAFNADGEAGPFFSGGDTATINDMAMDGDRIVVAGTVKRGAGSFFALARFSPDGKREVDFAGGIMMTTAIGDGNDSATCVKVQGDGKIVVAGSSESGGRRMFALARYMGGRRIADVRVGLDRNASGGNGIYNLTGVGQKLKVAVAHRGREKNKKLFIRIENDGTSEDSFTVSCSYLPIACVVQFFHGSTNVTRRMQYSKLRTGPLKPGESYLIKANIYSFMHWPGKETFNVTTNNSADFFSDELHDELPKDDGVRINVRCK